MKISSFQARSLSVVVTGALLSGGCTPKPTQPETGYMFLAGQNREFKFEGKPLKEKDLLCKTTKNDLSKILEYNRLFNNKFGQGSATRIKNEYLPDKQTYLGPGHVPDLNSNGKVDQNEKFNTIIGVRKNLDGSQQITEIIKVRTEFESSYLTWQLKSALQDRALRDFSLSIGLSSLTCSGTAKPPAYSVAKVGTALPTGKTVKLLTPFAGGDMSFSQAPRFVFSRTILRNQQDLKNNKQRYDYKDDEWLSFEEAPFMQAGSSGAAILNPQTQEVIGAFALVPNEDDPIGEAANLTNPKVRLIYERLSKKLAK